MAIHHHEKGYFYANEESIETKLLEHSLYWHQPIESHHGSVAMGTSEKTHDSFIDLIVYVQHEWDALSQISAGAFL